MSGPEGSNQTQFEIGPTPVLPRKISSVPRGFVFVNTFLSPDMETPRPPPDAVEAIEKRLS